MGARKIVKRHDEANVDTLIVDMEACILDKTVVKVGQ